MKKFTCFALLLALSCAFCGCNQTDPQIKRSQELEQGLKAELENFKSLRASLDQSSRNFEEQKAQRLAEIEAGEKVADQIADALEKDEYPVNVLGARYDDRETLGAQLESILDQMQSAKTAVDSFKEIERDVLRKQQTLILKISETENQLATYDVKRALFVAGKATDETASLIAEMDRLFESNETFIKDNPIRTIEELAKVEAGEKAASERDKRIEEYLKNRRGRNNAEDKPATESVEDKSATESVEDKSATESVEDKTATENVEVQKVDETSAENMVVNDEPKSESATPLADAFLRLRAASQEAEKVESAPAETEKVESAPAETEKVESAPESDQSAENVPETGLVVEYVE